MNYVRFNRGFVAANHRMMRKIVWMDYLCQGQVQQCLYLLLDQYCLRMF